MKICIDLTSLSYHLSGIERYALNIAKELLRRDDRNKYILVFRDKIVEDFTQNKGARFVVLKGNNKLIFNQVILPIELYKVKADVYLFLAFPPPLLFVHRRIFSTIHDMNPWDCPETMKKLNCLYWKILVRHAINISKGIITVSNFTKNRITEILNYDLSKILVAYSGLNKDIPGKSKMRFDSIRKKYNLPDEYILALSTIEPRKNLDVLIEEFLSIVNEVSFDLVLVGRKGWMMDRVLQKCDNNRIHFTGFVDDDDLAEVYRNAICFVFPSLYEGFGLPPIEALSYGTPVIASDSAAIPEILMDRAVYYNNSKSSDLGKLLLTVTSDVKYMWKNLNEFQENNYLFSESVNKIMLFISNIINN